MYKQLGSSPSINPYSQNQDTEEKDKSDKNSPNSSLETRAHATKRAKGHNNSRSQQHPRIIVGRCVVWSITPAH